MSTNPHEPPKELPFYIDGMLAGKVTSVTCLRGFYRGVLSLDTPHLASPILAVVKLASEVDKASCVEAWEEWNAACSELPVIGIGPVQAVEEFSIDSDWLIEWSEPDNEAPWS